MSKNPWLLPDGIEDLLPTEALAVEQLRRNILDAYQSWGYKLVTTPMIEFIDSVVGNLGEDLNLKTFKVTDQHTGKTMGIRADITPQIARLDASLLAQNGINRFCYAGTVLHTRSDQFANTRSPLQVGCELFGHFGDASDFEIIQLMVATFEAAQISNVTLDLGHVGIYKIIAAGVGLCAQQEQQFFELLQRKAVPEIDAWLKTSSIAAEFKPKLRHLVDLNGSVEVLSTAKELYGAFDSQINVHLDKLAQLVAKIKKQYPHISLNIDLAELHGYHYKNGVVFAAYVPDTGHEIARGGRYDGIGKAFNCQRPATGFSADLKTLLTVGKFEPQLKPQVMAPNDDCPQLRAKINHLRTNGYNVVQTFDGSIKKGKLALVKIADKWQLLDS